MALKRIKLAVSDYNIELETIPKFEIIFQHFTYDVSIDWLIG